MRFNCGPSKEEKAAIKRKKWQEYCSKWHTFFAIYPVRTIDGPCVWLEKVEGRVIPWTTSQPCTLDTYIYRLVGSDKTVKDGFKKYGYNVPDEYKKE